MEFIWRPMYSHLGRRAQLLGHVLYDFDTSPLEILVEDRKPKNDPTDGHIKPNQTDNSTKHDNSTSKDDNESRLYDYVLEMSQYYRTKHLLLVMGANVNFEKSEYYYKQLEDAIGYFNSKHSDTIEMSMSTFSLYAEIVGHVDKEMEVAYWDMMPYSADGMTFNTGLFTSRPNLKAAIRQGSRVLHAANKLYISKIFG